MTFSVYLSAIEEHLLEEMMQRAHESQNQIMRLAVRSLFIYGAEHGFDHLDLKIADAARLAHEHLPGS